MVVSSGKNIVQLPQNHATVGYNYNGVTNLEYGVPVGNLRSGAMADTDHQHIDFQLDTLQRNAAESGLRISQDIHGLLLIHN